MGATEKHKQEMRALFDEYRGKEPPKDVLFKHIHWDGEDIYVPLNDEELAQREADTKAHEERMALAANAPPPPTVELLAARIAELEESQRQLIAALEKSNQKTRKK